MFATLVINLKKWFHLLEITNMFKVNIANILIGLYVHKFESIITIDYTINNGQVKQEKIV